MSRADLFPHVVKGYLDCALWLADDEAGPGEYDASGRTVSPAAQAQAMEDVAAMVESAGEDFDAYLEQRGGIHEERTPEGVAQYFGHDFFLTRNGHGAGFWDRGLGELGDRLTALSKPYGEQSSWLNDNGELELGL
jgi:hypothetical protein